MSFADTVIRQFEPQIASTLAAVRRLERFLRPSDDWVERQRRIVYEVADSLLRPLGRSTVTEKGTSDYVTTVRTDPDTVETILHDAGYQRNLLSTRKYRLTNQGGRGWAVGSWVLDPLDTDWQHHVYLFDHDDGERTDVYAHSEASVTEPSAHDGGDELQSGDPRGLFDVFDRHDIDYSRRNI